MKTLLVGLGLSPLVLTAGLALSASPAQAYQHMYCAQNLNPSAGCPPNGSSQWIHIDLNWAKDPYGNHEVCIDEFLDPEGSGFYTQAKCVYYSNETARDYWNYVWGYPRAWNGGSVYHWVEAEELGN